MDTKKILIIPIFVLLVTVLSILPKDVSATGPQIIFHDNYSSNVGWTQVGTQITVNSSQFPHMVKFNSATGGGGVTEERVYKTLSSTPPSDRWVAEFNYLFTSSSIPDHFIFDLTGTTDDPQVQSITHEILVEHIFSNQLTVIGKTASNGIQIQPNVQYYVSLERTPTVLELSVFSDAARTLQVSGSPVYVILNSSDYNNDLNYIQHDGCKNCGSGRVLTAQITNTTIYLRPISNTTPPPSPIGLTAIPSSSGIDLSWIAIDNGGSPITGYLIERDDGSGFNTIVANTGNTTTKYSDTGLSANSAHTYRVSAINAIGTSSPSNTASATTFSAPQPPTSLSASTVSVSQINLKWTAPSNNGGSPLTGYMIERSDNGGSTWSTVVANTGNTATAYPDTGLSPSTTYTYRVSAINAIGTGSPSNTASAKTLDSSAGSIDIKDQASCLSIANSTWNSSTCMLINATLFLANGDSLTVEPGITLALNKSNINNDGIITNDGAIQNRLLGTITNNGNLTNNGGSISNYGKITNAGNLINTASSSLLNAGGSITNTGTLNNNGVIQSNHHGTITTSGAITNSGNIQSYGMMTNSGTLTNTGKFQSGDLAVFDNNGGSGSGCESDGRLINTGTIINNNLFGYDNSNSLLNSGNITNNGKLIDICTISNQNGFITNFGTLNVGGGRGSISNTGTLNNFGTITIPPFITVFNNLGGTLTNTGVIFGGGALSNNGNLNNLGQISALTGSGTVNTSFSITDQNSCQLMSGSWDSGTSTCTINNITVGAGHSLQIGSGVTLSLTGTLNNFGTLTNSGVIKNSGTITNKSTGTLTNNGSILTSGAFNNMNILNNNGSLKKCSGTIHNSGTINGNPIVYGC